MKKAKETCQSGFGKIVKKTDCGTSPRTVLMLENQKSCYLKAQNDDYVDEMTQSTKEIHERFPLPRTVVAVDGPWKPGGTNVFLICIGE
ncbi:hypothetical protein HAX54_053374, partial [Datura stramonium]|nr:hypothetical protein [Datura stramonium]